MESIDALLCSVCDVKVPWEVSGGQGSRFLSPDGPLNPDFLLRYSESIFETMKQRRYQYKGKSHSATPVGAPLA